MKKIRNLFCLLISAVLALIVLCAFRGRDSGSDDTSSAKTEKIGIISKLP